MRIVAATPIKTQRNITFGDWETQAELFKPRDAIKTLSEDGYRLSGSTNKDSFERLYDDMHKVLSKKANMTRGTWKENYSGYDDRIKIVVERIEGTKEEFAGMLTRFWENIKVTKPIKASQAVEQFLENVEGIKKPGFFESLLPGKETFFKKADILENVFDHFIKTGKHMLR